MKKGFIVIAISYMIVGVLLTQIIFTNNKPPEKIIAQPSPTINPLPSPTPPLNTDSVNATSTPKPTIKPSPKPKPFPSPTPTLYSDTESATLTSKPTTNLDDLFSRYGSEYGINPDLLKKIAKCESGFDPTSINGDYAGLFQFASRTWIAARGRMRLSSDLNLRANPEESIRTAAHYIAQNGTGAWANCD